jgi:CyaY protein
VTEPSFAVRAAQLLDQILEQLEAIDALEDLEMDLVDGVLTVTFEDGGKVIINRQEPTEQIWVASPLGPAHFSFDADANQWINDRSGEPLVTTLERAFSEKMREEIELEGGF